jgi:DNA repair exonuclease SbcCD ATPase subunit
VAKRDKTQSPEPGYPLPDFMNDNAPVAVADPPEPEAGPVDFGPHALPTDGESLSWAKIERALLRMWDGTANAAELEFLAVSGWIDHETNIRHKHRLNRVRACLKTCPSFEAFEQAKVDRDNVVAEVEETRERLRPERAELLARLAQIDAEYEACEQTLSQASDKVRFMELAIEELRSHERMPRHVVLRMGQLRGEIGKVLSEEIAVLRFEIERHSQVVAATLDVNSFWHQWVDLDEDHPGFMDLKSLSDMNQRMERARRMAPELQERSRRILAKELEPRLADLLAERDRRTAAIREELDRLKDYYLANRELQPI